MSELIDISAEEEGKGQELESTKAAEADILIVEYFFRAIAHDDKALLRDQRQLLQQ